MDSMIFFIKNILNGYADDAKLIGISNNLMQHDLYLIENWSNSHKMPINTLKCLLIQFSKNSNTEY